MFAYAFQLVSFVQLFPQKFNKFFLFPMFATCPAHLALLDVINLIFFFLARVKNDGTPVYAVFPVLLLFLSST